MKNKWLLFVVVYLAAVTVSLSQLKIVPVLGALSETLNISMTQVSWLMSIFTLAGIILAVPGATILGKLGPKKLLLLLVGTLILGNVLGAITNSYGLLLVSRAIEGIAFSMIILVGIVLISGWFAEGGAGTAIGIYTTFPAIASVIAMNVALPITKSLGMSSIWWIVAALSVLSFVLVMLVIPAPQKQPGDPAVEKVSLVEAASNGKIWLLAICQFCVGFILFTFITIYPTLFTSRYGLEPGTANFYAGLNGLFGIPFCILSGAIIDKTRNAPLLTLVSFVGMAISGFITSMLGPSTYVLHTLLIAMFCGLVIPAVLYIAPSVAKRPALIGYSIAFVNLLYYVGIFSGSPLVLGAVEKSGWQSAANIFTVVSLIGFAAMAVFMVISKTKQTTVES